MSSHRPLRLKLPAGRPMRIRIAFFPALARSGPPPGENKPSRAPSIGPPSRGEATVPLHPVTSRPGAGRDLRPIASTLARPRPDRLRRLGSEAPRRSSACRSAASGAARLRHDWTLGPPTGCQTGRIRKEFGGISGVVGPSPRSRRFSWAKISWRYKILQENQLDAIRPVGPRGFPAVGIRIAVVSVRAG